MSNNKEFIDGSWYEKQYATPGSLYHNTYVKPQDPRHIKYARETNALYAHLIAAYVGLKPSAHVLDLGSGIGMYMKAWGDLGCITSGIEISKTAHSFAKFPKPMLGSAENMPMFGDNSFDLVFSAAFLEHVDESILNKVMVECDRVGAMQVHLISTEVANDPSHINIKTMEEWRQRFADVLGGFVVLIPDYILGQYPILISYPVREVVPHPVAMMLIREGVWE